MQYLGYTYIKVICCSSEIQNQLGVLYFIWQPYILKYQKKNTAHSVSVRYIYIDRSINTDI